ncbi:MAG: TonB-dependent receptor [Bacteroidota bacterium]
MKNFYLNLLFLLLAMNVFAQSGSITGKVTDATTGDPLIGATILLKGSQKGDVTNVNGEFSIKGVNDGDYVIVVSFLGFESIEESVTVSGGSATVAVQLTEGITFGDEVVISGTRTPEKITETPATIEVISKKDLENWGSFNTGELLSRLKGVDYVRSGVVGTGINVRGFNSNFNAKNTQVSDGRFSSLIATGLPFGPLSPQIKEDIERVEVILGPNSALYGPNAHNGLVNIITKDPRSSQGTTFALGAGNQSVFTARGRHAQVLSDKFAFKLNFEYTSGEEFEFADSVYLNRNGVRVAEEEIDLDNDFEFIKGGASLYYTVNDDSDLIFSYDASNSTYLAPTNVGRNEIIDWRVQTFHLRYTSPRIFAQAYMTLSDTEETHSLDDRTKAYYGLIDAGVSPADALPQSLEGGARFIDDSKRWNGEVQYNNQWGQTSMVTGVQAQRDFANSNGTYLLDEDEDDFITVNQIGWYWQGQLAFGNGFKATAATRVDNHEIYGTNFVPKIGLTKNIKRGTFRATYGQGVAAPTILNMFGNLFGGLILGNAEGFTVLTLDDNGVPNGTRQVERQSIERLQTYEVGYKGSIGSDKLYADVNAYVNISEDFLSPVTNIGLATERGTTPIGDLQTTPFAPLVFTYVNFGQFTTYGFDIGLNYLLSDNLTLDLNYSFFDFPIDENELENDFDGDGVVTKLDVLVNAPRNKGSLGLNYAKGKFFGNVFLRWVEEFDYFSSFQIAAETQDMNYRGVPIVENARSADTWNYGPLGGFVNVDLGLGYKITDQLTASAAVTNLFDAEYREFTASPFIGRLYSLELRLNVPSK